MKDLKAAGANFETDDAKANTLFQQGNVDMAINGPWVLGNYKKDLGDKLGVAPMPAGPDGAATPLAGVDYWYVNPNARPSSSNWLWMPHCSCSALKARRSTPTPPAARWWPRV